MKKYIFTSLALLAINLTTWGQCTLNLIASEDSILCGDCVTLSAFGYMDGNVAFQEDFNSGSPTGWQFTQSVTIADNTCGVPSPDGSNFMWMGDAAVNPRDMTTNPMDLSPGGIICFEMRYAIQGEASPCEGPDEPDEGVHLQYSTDGGTTWIDIDYWDPNGGNDPSLTSWNQYCVSLPPGAQTTSTMIQWHQDAVSGSEYDHWGIDNVQITLNDPSAQITWLHDNYNYPTGSSGGPNPTPVCLTTETTFTAQITNGTNTCTQSITIPVRMPVLNVFAGDDITICSGDCVDLAGEAGVIVNPGGSKTFSNTQAEDASGLLGIAASTNINVQNVNQQTITSGLITSVCVDAFSANGNIFSPLSESDFSLTLTTPDGCSIELVPTGIANGPYSNVCFIPSGGGNINGGSFPSAGNWNPNSPFSSLNGCTTNGVWTLTFQTAPGLTLGSATLSGWSITFNDIDSLEAGIFSWTPTTNMTGENSLTPNVCPTTTTTYTLTVADSNGCVPPVSDDVVVTVAPSCCNFDISAVVTQPSCGGTDGGIDLTIANGSGNYTFDWGTNGTTEDLTSIGSGTYSVTVTDATAGCSKDTSFVLQSSAFTYSVTTTNPGCGSNDGSITISTSGGTLPFTFSIDGGTTTSNDSVFSNLSSGTYDIVVQDGSGCQLTSQEILSGGGSLSATVNITDLICFGDGSGRITIAPIGGASPYSYDIGSGAQSVAVFNDIDAGNYNITVTDDNGCTFDTTVTVSEPAEMNLSLSIITQPSCSYTCDGEVEAIVTGGTLAGDPVYQWASPLLNNTTSTASNLCPGNYSLTVTDDNGCTKDTTFTMVAPPGVDADFTATPQPTTILNPKITLTENTDDAVSFIWLMNGDVIGSGAVLIYDYPADTAGVYPTCIVATNNAGCVDTTCHDVVIGEEFIFFVPNTFTPDGDGDNDYFYPKGLGIENVEYELLIFNRWGEIIWRSQTTNGKWDGTENNSGKPCPVGTYVWKLKTLNKGRKNIEKMGHVNLLR